MVGYVREAIMLAAKHYDKKTLLHALSVAEYAVQDPTIREEQADAVYAVAVLHDILEDTSATEGMVRSVLGISLTKSVLMLTKGEDQTYDEYMKDILDGDDHLALVVKRADYKDHFSRVETLTPKLMEKYAPYIGRLM